MFGFFKRKLREDYRIILSVPPEDPSEDLVSKTGIAFIYVYPVSYNDDIFEYRIPDIENKRYYVGTIADHGLVESLKMASHILELSSLEQNKLISLIFISNTEKLLISAIQNQERGKIEDKLKNALGKQPTEEAVNVCLDNLIEQMFRTPKWYEMLEKVQKEVLSKNLIPSSYK